VVLNIDNYDDLSW